MKYRFIKAVGAAPRAVQYLEDAYDEYDSGKINYIENTVSGYEKALKHKADSIAREERRKLERLRVGELARECGFNAAPCSYLRILAHPVWPTCSMPFASQVILSLATISPSIEHCKPLPTNHLVARMFPKDAIMSCWQIQSC